MQLVMSNPCLRTYSAIACHKDIVLLERQRRGVYVEEINVGGRIIGLVHDGDNW